MQDQTARVDNECKVVFSYYNYIIVLCCLCEYHWLLCSIKITSLTGLPSVADDLVNIDFKSKTIVFLLHNYSCIPQTEQHEPEG